MALSIQAQTCSSAVSQKTALSALCQQVLLVPGAVATALHVAGALPSALRKLRQPAKAAGTVSGAATGGMAMGIPATRPREPKRTGQGLPQGIAKALAAITKVSRGGSKAPQEVITSFATADSSCGDLFAERPFEAV